MKHPNIQRIFFLAGSFFTLFFVLSRMISPGEHQVFIPTSTSPAMTVLPAKATLSNVETTVTQDGFIQTTADLSLSPIGKGFVEIMTPSEMLISETYTVTLAITPDKILADSTPTPNVTPPSLFQRQQQYVATQQAVAMYPVLTAELQGAYFQVLPNGPVQKIVTGDSVVEWLWVITPLATGKQVLLLSLSTPVAVGSNQEVFGTMEIATLSIDIKVHPGGEATFMPTISSSPIAWPTATSVPIPTATQPPPSERVAEQLVNNIGTIISAVLAFLGTALTAYVTYIVNRNTSDEDDGKAKKVKDKNKTAY